MTEHRLPDQDEHVYAFALSSAQERMWFLEQLESGTANQIVGAVELCGALDTRALRQALDGLVQRHEALRTTFRTMDGQPVQVIAEAGTAAFDVRAVATEDDVQAALAAEARRPFDLGRGPLLRVLLLARGAERHVFVVAIHHIVCDGWSLGVFMKELAALYAAARDRTEPQLPVLPIQYADYAQWQRDWLGGEALTEHLAYWRTQLPGPLPVLELPTDHSRPPVESHRGAWLPFSLSAEATRDLTALGRRENATLFMVLMTAFATLLARYTGQEDVIVGTPVAGRSRPELEGLIGLFLNTLVLRTDATGDPTFVELLRRVRETALNAYAHQDVPFERLVEELRPALDPSRNPLFQVMFVLQSPAAAPEFPGLTMRPLEMDRGASQVDLTLSMMNVDDRLQGHWEYSTDLFDRTTMERLAAHYEQLLVAALADPTRRLSELSLLTPDERHRVVQQFNATAVVTEPGTFVARFERQAALTPEACSVRFEGAALTYGELNQRANRVARHLRTLGVAPGALVGLCVPRSLDMIVALLGIQKSGGAYVPLDPGFPAERLDFMLADSGATVLVTADEAASGVDVPDGVRVVDLGSQAAALANLSPANLEDPAGLEDAAYVIYTSGSTGRPKGVGVSHGALANFLASMQRTPGLTEADVLAAVTTISFDIAGLELFLPLMVGAGIELLSRETAADGPALAAQLAACGATVLQATPATWRLLIEAGWPGSPGMRALCGGEALTRDLADALLVRTQELWNLYGPTETTIWSTVERIEHDERPITIGRPIANTQVYVLDRHGDPVPIGIPGELWIGGAGVALGYHGRPDLTAERFVPDRLGQQPGGRLYRTGDLGRWRADGRLEHLGRLDNQVKIRGFRIELGEIESALERHPHVRQAVVGARIYGPGDTRLVAYVVAESEAEPNFNELRNFLRSALPEYMIPWHFVLLIAFPLTPNGKVDRKALPAPEADRQTEELFVAPCNDTERRLAAIWEESLQVRGVGVHDSFFELGGNSLRAMEVVFRIRKSFGVQLPLITFLQSRTIAALALLLADDSGIPSDIQDSSSVQGPGSEMQVLLELHPEERYEPFPLTDVQEAYWIGRGSGFDIGNVATHVYAEAEIDGLDIIRYEQTWQRLIDRHEMLRAIIRPDGQQQILEHTPPFRIKTQDLNGQSVESAQDAIAAARQEMSHQVLPADQWPLFEIRAFKLADNRYRIHFGFDLLIGDAWSFTVLQRDFDQLYSEPEHALAPLGISFRDYVLALSKYRESTDYQRSLAYWDARSHTLPHRPELPLARNPGSIERPRFERRRDSLEPECWDALKEKAEAFGLTQNGLLLAAYADVLATWSRRPRFTINLTLFNRLPIHPHVQDLVGDFTSITLLEVELLPAETFLELAKKLLSRLWEDLDHRFVSGVQVLRRIAREQQDRASGVAPVVLTSTLGFGNPPVDPSSLASRTNVVFAITQTPQVWLDHMVWVEDGKVILTWDAVDELFPPGMVDDMFQAYVGHLRRLAQENTAWVEPRSERVKKLVPAWQRLQLESVNATARPVSDELLHVLFERQAQVSPEQTAIVCQDVRLTYSDVVQLSRRMGRQLRALGARPNSLVAIVMEKGWEQAVAALGILQSGAAYVPIDANLPRERLLQLLENSQAELVLTQPALDKTLVWPSGVRRLCVERPEPGCDAVDRLEPVQGPEDLAYVIYTSGSTGLPKGVMIDHRGAVNTILDMNQRFSVSPSDRVLALSSLSFDLSVYDIFGMLAAGAAIVIPEASATRDPARWAELARQEHVTIWNSVPALMEMFVEYASGRSEALPPSLRLVLLSGDWIPVTLPDQIRALAEGIQVMSLGGATEASIWSILYPIDRVDPAWKSIPYGRPMINQTFYVLDESLEPCPVWVPGQLYIGGIGLAKGYWRDEEKTNAKFIIHPRSGDRLYSTGDLGRYLPGGDIEFLGREDFQVKIRGFRIELGEIEAAFRQHPAVRSVVVTAVGKTTAERRLVAYVVPEHERETDSRHNGANAEAPAELGLETTLQAFLAEKLPEHMCPSRIVLLDRLPLTPNGKVDYRSLPEPEVATLTQETAHAAPRNEMEATLVEVWQEVLRVGEVGIHDSFFDLGGDSVNAIQVVSRANRKGYRLAPIMIFRYPTVAELAHQLAGPPGSHEDREEMAL